MPSDCAKPFSHLAHAVMRGAIIALGLSVSFTAQAQDIKAQDCNVNTPSDVEICPPTEQEATDLPAYPLDWVPLAAVPESLRDRQCINCDGRYIDPLAAEDTDTAPEDSEIFARADSSELMNDEVILIGSADAVQGYRHMRGDKVVVDRQQESAFLSGNVTLREPGVLLLGDSAEIYSKTGEAVVHNGEFVFHREHMRGSSDLMERDADGLIHIHNGTFTYCAPGENDWAVLTEVMEVDLEEGVATARNARIEVEGVPVFYSPWLRFPLDDRRRTGFLWPDFGNDSTGGLDITVPFYMNLAPNYDALYSPRYIEERGLNHELNLRYLDPLLGFWSVGGTYMNHDDRYADETPDNVSDDRWLAVVKQSGLLDQRWRSTVDYSKASDVDYMKDLEPYSIEAQRKTSLRQLASMDYLGDRWLLNLEAEQFQSLADDIRDDYKKLPQFTAQYRASGTPFELQPIGLGQYSNFGSDEDRVTGERVYGEAGLRYPMLWSYGSLTPTVKYRQVNYELSDGEASFPSDNPSTSVPLASLDGSLIFERNTSFAGKSLLQTLEPHLYYLYSPYEDQTNQPDFDSAELTFTYYQLFRETRFSGHDRLDDANQISVGLTSRFLDDQNGRSLLSASIGQIYYFEDRKVRLLAAQPPLDASTSNIAGQLDFTPIETFGLRSSMVWDPGEDKMESAYFQSSYRADNDAIFNVGYSFLRPFSNASNQQDTEEVSVSSYFPVNKNWSLFAAMDYSLEGDESVEDMVGVEYDSCCWTFRLMHLRYFDNVSGKNPNFNDPDLERENTTQFQIVLKGMGGFGNRITDVMQDMIRGFEERDY